MKHHRWSVMEKEAGGRNPNELLETETEEEEDAASGMPRHP
jgi:hypothetical protein